MGFLKSRIIQITFWQGCYLLGLIAFAAFAISFGFRLRIDLFDWTHSIHHDDLLGAHRRGAIIAREGIFSIYDRIADPDSNLQYATIDYAPLRVLVIGSWARWFESHFPGQQWTTDYDHVWPLLTINTIAELISAVIVFLLIHHWLGRTKPREATWTHGLNTSLIGSLLFWFNPAMLWNAHCWPQWDVWLVPFFLLSVYLSSKKHWFFSGISIATGTFFKGQILLVAPILLLWPMLQRRWKESMRLVAGFASGCLFISFAWMGTISQPAINWLILFAIITLINSCFRRPDFSLRDWISYNVLIFSVAWFCILIHFGASMTWYTIGFEFGTHKFPNLASASGTYSIPTILRDYFNFPDDMDTPILIGTISIPVRQLMFGVYGLCLLLCSVAAARLDRKNSPAFLLTIVTPWICFFSLLTQMNNRYLVWGAMFSASLTIAVNRGLLMLGVLLSLICLSGMAQHMLPIDPNFAPQMTRWVSAMQTHLAWPVALIGVTFLYQTMASCRFLSKNEIRGTKS